MNKIIFCGSTREIDNIMFRDLQYDRGITYIDYPECFKNPFMHILYWLCNHTFGKWQKYFYRDFCCMNNNALAHYKFEQKESYTVFFTNPAIENYPLQFLKKLQKKYSIRYVLILIDTLDKRAAAVAKKCVDNQLFDTVYTIDHGDAVKYGFRWTMSVYSKQPVSLQVSNLESDLVFVGNDKGRCSVLEKIYIAARKNNVKTDFTINCVFDDEQLDGITYNHDLTYQQVVEKTIASNCLLEVVQGGQSGATLRYYEAICYNKKLYTNNRNITVYPYYNPKYMRIFSTIDEIDYDWIKKKENVDYGCGADVFSPRHLLKE